MDKKKLWLVALCNPKLQIECTILGDYDDLVDYVDDPNEMTPEEAAWVLGGEGWICDGIVVVEVVDGDWNCLPIGFELRKVE